MSRSLHTPLLRRAHFAELLRPRPQREDPDVARKAAEIVLAVRREGEPAVRRLALQLGDWRFGEPLVLRPPALREALEALPAEQRGLLERTADRVRAFARLQRDALGALETAVPGGRAGLRYQPIERAGCYAPGGRYPLPSSLLMTAVTARAAGVGDVWAASPRPGPLMRAAAAVAGVDGLLCVGGAQAIAAMTWGAGEVPACDMIAGPGNAWVVAAKKAVMGEVRLDVMAGASEVLIVADASADPQHVAADLLAQAEHDPDALPMLVCTDAELPALVEHALAERLADLPSADVAVRALEAGFHCVVSSREEAARVADALAPEHLSLHVEDAESWRPLFHHYGSLFVGGGASAVLGDYGIGPNHVLPTGGTARRRGALCVLDFLRVQTWLRVDDASASADVARDAAAMARLEGLEAHARAAEARLGG
jgi:histidinol dehydrogenase